MHEGRYRWSTSGRCGGKDTGRARNVLETFLHDQALRAQAHGKDHPPLVVEVAEDDRHALALLTERVGQWNTDLIECHECCARSRRVCSLDRLSGKLIRAGNKNDGVSAFRLAANGEVIGECTIRYPSVRLPHQQKTVPATCSYSKERRTFSFPR